MTAPRIETVAMPAKPFTPDEMGQITKVLREAGVQNVYVTKYAVNCRRRHFGKAKIVLQNVPFQWSAFFM